MAEQAAKATSSGLTEQRLNSFQQGFEADRASFVQRCLSSGENNTDSKIESYHCDEYRDLIMHKNNTVTNTMSSDDMSTSCEDYSNDDDEEEQRQRQQQQQTQQLKYAAEGLAIIYSDHHSKHMQSMPMMMEEELNETMPLFGRAMASIVRSPHRLESSPEGIISNKPNNNLNHNNEHHSNPIGGGRVSLTKRDASYDWQLGNQAVWLLTLGKATDYACFRSLELFCYFLTLRDTNGGNNFIIHGNFFIDSVLCIASFELGIILSTATLHWYSSMRTRKSQILWQSLFALSLALIGGSRLLSEIISDKLIIPLLFDNNHSTNSSITTIIQITIICLARILGGYCISNLFYEWSLVVSLFSNRRQLKSNVGTFELSNGIAVCFFVVIGYTLQHLYDNGHVLWYVLCALCLFVSMMIYHYIPAGLIVKQTLNLSDQDLYPPFSSVLNFHHNGPLLIYFIFGFGLSSFANACLCICLAPYMHVHYGLNLTKFSYILLFIAVSQFGSQLLSYLFSHVANKLRAMSNQNYYHSNIIGDVRRNNSGNNSAGEWAVVAGVSLQLLSSLVLLLCDSLASKLPLLAVLVILTINFIGFEYSYAHCVSSALHLSPSMRGTPIGNFSRVIVSLSRISGIIIGACLWTVGEFNLLIEVLTLCFFISLIVVSVLTVWKPKHQDDWDLFMADEDDLSEEVIYYHSTHSGNNKTKQDCYL